MKKIFFLLLIASSIYSQQILDKIVAVVDNEVILYSELDFRVMMEAQQMNLNPADTLLRRKVLNDLIAEKLLYAQAEMDTIKVQDEQVKANIDQKISYFIQQYGSREKVEQMYGMSIEKIKRSFQDDIRKSMMAQSLTEKKFGQLEASRKEVEDFFVSYKDSMSVVPEKFYVSHIFQNPKAGERIKKKARDFALSLLDSLKAGKDFAELAKKYSDDGSAAKGGELDFAKRGQLVPEYEAAAYSLAPKQISGLVESQYGYHIIQLLERRGDAINTRHILIKVKADDQSDLVSIEFLTELRDSIIRKFNTFEYYARKYSDDKENAKFGGEIGAFEANQLDKPLLDIIYKLKEGDISFPKRLEVDKSNYGYHIVKLTKRVSEHRPNIDADYIEIKRIADYTKKQKAYGRWIDELKAKIFWEVRL